MIRVGVVGSRGRMGAEVVSAVLEAPDLDLVASIDAGDSFSTIIDAGAQVIVDFTTPDAVMQTLRDSIAAGIHAVVGTTGFDDDRLAAV